METSAAIEEYSHRKPLTKLQTKSSQTKYAADATWRLFAFGLGGQWLAQIC